MKATDAQINRLYQAIDYAFGVTTGGGEVLDTIRDVVGRWNFSYYDELTSEEIERAIKGLGE